MTREPYHVVVVGAGIAGLATAWYAEREAAARGLVLSCTVLEKSDRAGGKVLTETVSTDVGEFMVEGGPDSFLAVQKPWAVGLATELGLSDQVVGTNDRARKVYVLSRGRPLRLPDGIFLLAPTRLRPFLCSRLISPWGKLRMGLDLVIPGRPGDEDETLGDFVIRRFGSEALDKIAEPLLSGIYSAEVGRQSLLATFPRFREMEREYGSVIRAGLAARRRATGFGGEPGPDRPNPASGSGPHDQGPGQARRQPPSMFVSFRRGTYQLIEGLLGCLRARVEYGAEVVGISRRAGSPDRYLVQVAGGAATIEADAVVLAVPASTAALLLDPLAPVAAETLRSIRYVSTGIVSLGYAADASWVSIRERVHGFGILVPAGEKLPINAVTWSSVKFPGRAPDGYESLRVFFGGSRSPRSMDLDDTRLLEVVREQLRRIMGVSGSPLFYRVHRWEQANPQYDVGHLDRVDAVEAALPPRLWVTGSSYRGIGLPDCARQAGEVARDVADELSR
jgi:oxygen-dependent protoporphyrinogen oxidase